MQRPDGDASATPTLAPDAKSIPTGGGMPPRALPSRPIPHHEPGHPAKAANYNTQVRGINAEGMEETIQLTGLDALMADNVMDDPLQGNYRIVNQDKLMWSSYHDLNYLTLQTFELVTPTLSAIPGSWAQMGNHRFYDIAAGDLNGDLQDEQITAWIGDGNQIYLSTGEMPGSLGRATSAPAVVSSDGGLDLVVRGYDDALWYHDGASWQNAGGRLLSGPAVASRAAGQFDVFAAGLDDSVEPNYLVVWHNQWDGANWAGWEALDDPDEGSPPLGWPIVERNVPTPELPAPAVVANGSGQLDLFWLWPDNTLRWRHFNGATWDEWQNLSGMLASGPGAVAHDGQIDVFARGVDDALWTRTYNGSWGSWQRVDRAGMPGGVTIASAPAAVSPAAGQVLVTVRGSDDRLWQLAYDGSSWGSWNYAGLDKSTQAQIGRAMQFDGVNDCVETEAALTGTGPFAVGAWVTTTATSDQVIIQQRSPSVFNGEYQLRLQPDGRVMWWTYGDGQYGFQITSSGPVTVSDGNWHHIAAVRETDGTGRIYIDGALDSSDSSSPPRTLVSTQVYIGADMRDMSQYFGGSIDEVAVFDRALSAAEVADIFSTGWDSSSGKVLALHLDENPATHGATLADVSGQGNHGTLYTFGGGKFASAPAATAHGGQIDLFALTRDGHLGHALYDGSTWKDWTNFEGLGVGAVYPTGAVAANVTGNDTLENLLLDVETGYFTGDGREQIALGYESGFHQIRIELYDIHDGFMPLKIAELTAPISGFSVRITAADVDGDGTDEIGIAHLVNNAYYYKVEVYDIEEVGGSWTGNLVKLDNESPTFYSCSAGCGDPGDDEHWFAGTLRITSGDFVAETNGQNPNDEIAVLSDWGDSRVYEDYDLWVQLYILDNDYDTAITDCRPETDSNCPMADMWRVDSDDDNFWDNGYATGVGLAAGDVNGDGYDEIVLTWPGWFDGEDWPDLVRYLRILNARSVNPIGATPSERKPTVLAQHLIAGYQRYSYLDTLAVGDLDRDLQDEIVFYQLDTLAFYEYNTLTGVLELRSTIPSASGGGPKVNLVMGDFTGESLRVGPPTYRLESQVGGLIALINEPPKHFDTLDGVDYDINSTDSGTYASYENEQSQSTEMSLQVTRDWGMASGLEVTAGDPEGTHVTTSINNTYDEHFEKTTTEFNEITFGSSLIASHDDLADYSRTDYQVWEYPIYDDLGNTAAGYITVVFPQPVGNNQGTVEAFTPGSTCDFWYQPNHEINNVWSYPMDLTRFTDFDNDKGALNQIQVLTLGGVEGDFWTSWSDVTTENQASAVNLGVSAGVEAQVGGDEIPIIGYKIPWSVKASFEASYEEGTLSTHEVVGSDTTTVHAHFNPIDPSASYEVTPYLYWSQDGYLVLDYVTNPIIGTSFWSRYDKADPAFIRPWSDGHCGTDRADFSKEIVVTPSFVNNGELITVAATVRNYSNVGISNVKVRFYQGDPAQSGVQLGSDQVIATLDPRGLYKVSIQTPIYGSDEQHIYAVIDPDQQLTEMHLENNIAYGVVMIGASDYVDPGQVIQRPYIPLTYTNPISIATYTPPGNFTETTRFELKASSLSVPSVVGEPFELLAYQGSSGSWDTPIDDFDLKPGADDPPTVIAIAYDDADIAGMDEANLCLFRLSTNGWKEATCAGYAMERFPEDNLIAVPVCQAGVFALSAEIPESLIFLPLVLRNAP